MSWNDVTIIPSLLFSVSQFCTPPEVKFHVFGPSKHREEKLLSNNFFFILISTLWRFYRANKKKSVIYTLKNTRRVIDILGNPDCKVTHPISIDYNLIEVNADHWWSIKKRPFLESPIPEKKEVKYILNEMQILSTSKKSLKKSPTDNNISSAKTF